MAHNPASTMQSPRPHRRRIDLRQQPPATRIALALMVVVAVALLAWWLGRDDPVPTWITDRLVPLLGWAWLALAAVALIARWQHRRQAGRDAARRPEP
jgi:cell shape-determining protein MreD